MSENFWVPTCSEELITSDKELNTKDYVELDNHSMQSRLWFLFLSATVSALWHPCTSERNPALFFTGHSQARERVPRKNVGCTAIQSGLTLQGVPVHSHRAQALSPISSSIFTTFTFSPEPTLLFLTTAPLLFHHYLGWNHRPFSTHKAHHPTSTTLHHNESCQAWSVLFQPCVHIFLSITMMVARLLSLTWIIKIASQLLSPPPNSSLIQPPCPPMPDEPHPRKRSHSNLLPTAHPSASLFPSAVALWLRSSWPP